MVVHALNTSYSVDWGGSQVQGEIGQFSEMLYQTKTEKETMDRHWWQILAYHEGGLRFCYGLFKCPLKASFSHGGDWI